MLVSNFKYIYILIVKLGIPVVRMYIFILMFIYYYGYVCFVLGILHHFVFLCSVCVKTCTVLLLHGVNPIVVKYLYQTKQHYALTLLPVFTRLAYHRPSFNLRH